MTRRMIILAEGAVTPLGMSAATCAAVRAALTGFAESDFFQDTPDPVPLVAAQVPLGPPPAQDQTFDRLVRLAAAALLECLEMPTLRPDRTALLLGHREAYRDDPDLDGRAADLLPAIEQELQVRFHAASRVLPDGNAAVWRGLLLARDLLTAGQVEACIVGGVDSFLNAPDLSRFEDAFRLKREDVPQGFIPGEGAAFVALALPDPAQTMTSAAEIQGVGLADEDPAVTIVSDGHPTGKGLQRALQAALRDATIPEAQVVFRVSDLNGEYYRGIESVLAQNRVYRTHREQMDIWLPAACVGELGAAVGALMLILASTGMKKNYAPGPLAMCEASSDGGLRGGCLIGIPSVPVRHQP